MKLGLATQTGAPPASVAANNPLFQMAAASGAPLLFSPSSAALPAEPPSPSLLIANMFDPRGETEADWDLDIADEMRDECSKYGPLLHVWVDKNSQGHVYLRFHTTQAAQAAHAALNGRWFGGRQLVASYLSEEQYRSRVPG